MGNEKQEVFIRFPNTSSETGSFSTNSPKRGRVKGSLYLMRNEKQEVFQQTHPSVVELKGAYT